MGMILGFTGRFCAGKTAIIDHLTEQGFIPLSTSGVLRDEMREKQIEITRDTLRETANLWRTQRGAGVFGEMVAERIRATPDFENQNFTVDSIRHPDEVKALQALPNFHLIKVDAPVEIRYKRAAERKRENEHVESMEAFIASEEKEMSNPNPNGQQILATSAMANHTVLNPYETPEELYEDVQALLEKITRS